MISFLSVIAQNRVVYTICLYNVFLVSPLLRLSFRPMYNLSQFSYRYLSPEKSENGIVGKQSEKRRKGVNQSVAPCHHRGSTIQTLFHESFHWAHTKNIYTLNTPLAFCWKEYFFRENVSTGNAIFKNEIFQKSSRNLRRKRTVK